MDKRRGGGNPYPQNVDKNNVFFNPSLTWAVLQKHLLTESPVSSKSLKHHYSKTIRARELKFRRIFTPPTNVTCHVSLVRVMSNLSCVL